MSQNKIIIHRFDENPLIKAYQVSWLKWYPWFWRGALNCGVVYDENEKKFRMLFRGCYRMFSQLGYAESDDGIHWNINKNIALGLGKNFIRDKSLILGIEDPRIVKWVDGYYYVFATACLWDYYLLGGKRGKVAIWKTKDFKNFEWIGFPLKSEYESKNAVIFNECFFDGVYMLYRKWPDIWIARSDNAFLKGKWFDNKKFLGVEDVYKKDGLSPKKIGIAGPPIKTPGGWLLIFHAKFGESLIRNFYYSLGFMILEFDDPSHIKYLHSEPILWPENDEEKFGNLTNVVFSCATVDKGDDKIYVYWGGADTVVCGGYLKKEDLWMCY